MTTREDIAWLIEFVVEPEEFPNEGDRQWWQEKLQGIVNRNTTYEPKP